jgi:hypothetical protein
MARRKWNRALRHFELKTNPLKPKSNRSATRLRFRSVVPYARVARLRFGSALAGIPQITDPNALIRSRFPANKTFGKTFGAATGVSAPSYNEKPASETTNHAAKPPL